MGGFIYGRNSAELKKNGCQTKYACLRSSGVTAALRTLSPGLGPPPRLETEWTVLQSREEETLEDLPPNEEEAEVLGGSGVLQGPMMVLMTTRKNYLLTNRATKRVPWETFYLPAASEH